MPSRTDVGAWADDTIQFPRLIAEIEHVGGFTGELVEKLCLEMDLEPHELQALIERAVRKNDADKAAISNSGALDEQIRIFDGNLDEVARLVVAGELEADDMAVLGKLRDLEDAFEKQGVPVVRLYDVGAAIQFVRARVRALRLTNVVDPNRPAT